jgi:hypothetical protein
MLVEVWLGKALWVGHNAIVRLTSDELDDAVNEVAEVLKQLVVVAVDEWLPLELGVAVLWTVREEVVAEDVAGDADFGRGAAEDSNAARFGEFAAFVVEVLGCTEVVQFGPGVFGADAAAWEDYAVEGDVAGWIIR